MTDVNRDLVHLKAAQVSESIVSSRLRTGATPEEVQRLLKVSGYNREELARHTQRLLEAGLSQEEIVMRSR